MSKEPFKCIADAIEQIALQCPNGDDITYGRPRLTVMSAFIDQELYRKRIRILASNLPPSASDTDWQAHRKSDACKDDLELAVASYCATLGVDKFGNPIETETKPARRHGTNNGVQ